MREIDMCPEESNKFHTIYLSKHQIKQLRTFLEDASVPYDYPTEVFELLDTLMHNYKRDKHIADGSVGYPAVVNITIDVDNRLEALYA